MPFQQCLECAAVEGRLFEQTAHLLTVLPPSGLHGNRRQIFHRHHLGLNARHFSVLRAIHRFVLQPVKQRRLIRAAQWYLQRLRRQPDAVRFDVVAIDGDPTVCEPTIRLIRGAFRVE